MKYGIDNLDEDNSKMEPGTMRQDTAIDDDSFFVVPNHFTDSDSDIEVIEIESEIDEYICPIPTTEYNPSVFFEGLLDVYPVDSCIIAKLKFNNGFEKSPGDRVLLLPSGWRSLKEAVSVGLIKNDHVIFELQNLPKKFNELYHLCYSSTDQTVPGVSDAFSIREVTDEERMVSRLGPSSSRLSHVMNSLWTSLVVESDEPINTVTSEVHLEDNLVVSTAEKDVVEQSTFSCPAEQNPETDMKTEKEEKELGSELQEVTVMMEKQQLNAAVPNEENSNDDQSAEIQEISVMRKLVEKMEECNSLKNQVTKLESELTTTQNFVEYMITQKDERFERLSSDERNAHKYVYNTMKSRFGNTLGHYVEQGPAMDHFSSKSMYKERIEECKIEYEHDIRALKRTNEERMEALKQAHAKEIENLIQAQTKEKENLKRVNAKEMETLKRAHGHEVESLKKSFEEKSQGYASQLVYAKYQHDILEKNLKEMKEDYEAQLKCCAREYIKLKKNMEKNASAGASSSSNARTSYLTDLKARVRSINEKRRSKKEDSK